MFKEGEDETYPTFCPFITSKVNVSATSGCWCDKGASRFNLVITVNEHAKNLLGPPPHQGIMMNIST
jgi:hypothetical protein